MTQNKAILEYLKKHPEGITQLEAVQKFNCYRLSARIADLKHMGYSITTVMLEKNNKRFAQYRLMGEAGALEL